jgi:Ca2+-binding EF-hand superfamily protein
MPKDGFDEIPCIKHNPFKDKISAIFGFGSRSEITFKQFVVAIAQFNSSTLGRKDRKIKLAFHMHDIDGDGKISKEDLKEYIHRTTDGQLADTDVDEMALKVLKECAPGSTFITLHGFSRLIMPTDFHTKLILRM